VSTVADTIVAHQVGGGVRRVYGLPGDSLNGFTDALRRDGNIQWLHVRHEEAAAFAATAEATLTGELAVVAASCGPGNTHLLNGLFDANRSRVPVLAIAAQIPRPEIGSGYFQETHPQDLFREASVYCELVSTSEQMPRVLRIAMRTAVSRRGVAVVVVPGDVLLETEHGREQVSAVRSTATVSRPVGKEHVEYDNPFDVGVTGLLGFESGYRAMESCDALLVLGADFPYRDFYPKDVPVVQVDVRGEQIGRRLPVEYPLVGTVKGTLLALVPRLNAKEASDHNHLGRMRKHYVRTRRDLDKLANADHDRTPLHPQYLTQAVSEMASEDAIFIPDVGSPIIWSARYLAMNGRRRLIGSFIHGSMANAMPQGIGAQAAFPDRQVITLSGDGGIAMLLGDLITLRQHNLPVKVVVFNNGALAFVELEMMSAGVPKWGTDLNNPDFAEVARSVGLFGVRVERPDELRPALKAAFEHDGPALIDVHTRRQELSVPPHLTFSEMKGVTLFAGRTILSGRGDELVELARENVL
jgi:pyruvate dehydrogenase (quinone)